MLSIRPRINREMMEYQGLARLLRCPRCRIMLCTHHGRCLMHYGWRDIKLCVCRCSCPRAWAAAERMYQRAYALRMGWRYR